MNSVFSNFRMDTREHRAQGKGRDFGMNAGTNLVGRLKNGAIDGEGWQDASFADIVKGFGGGQKTGKHTGPWGVTATTILRDGDASKNGVLVAGTTHRFPEVVG